MLYSRFNSRSATAIVSGDLFRVAALGGFLCLMSACAVDPSAVKSFSALAPDQTKLDSLTQAYANIPSNLIDLDVLNRLSDAERAALVKDEATRKDQLTAIDGIHTVLVNYMKALGALADNTLVQTSTDTTTLTKGITALQTAEPTLGITTAQITAIGDLSNLLGDAATSYYREQQLSEIIGRANAPFQELVGAEQQIVSRGILPDLQNLLERTKALQEVTYALQVDDAEQVSAANVAASTRSKHRSDAQISQKVDSALRRSGAADVASLFLLKRAIASDSNTITQQIQAATQYSTALDNIAKAHAALYAARSNVLTSAGAKSFIQQEGPILKEAYTALQALNKL